MSGWQSWAAGIIPSVGVGLVFWYVMRAVVRSDRNERAEIARIEAMDEARAAALAEKPDRSSDGE